MSRLRLQKLITSLVCAALFSAASVSVRATFADPGRPDDEQELFAKCWEYPASPDLSVTPVADTDRVYFLNVERKLEAVDLQTAVKIWASEIGGDVVSNLFTTENSVLLVTRAGESDKAVLRSLSKHTGVANWNATVSTSRATLGALNGSIVAVDSDGSVTAFHPSNGSQLWHTQLGNKIVGAPHFRSMTVTVATASNEIVDIAIGGQASVRLKARYLPVALLIEPSDQYLIGDDRGNLVFTAADGDRRWRFKNGARISYLLSYDAEFLVASFDNFLYKISRGGNVEWKRRLTGRVSGKPVVSGDTAVVSIIGDGSVYFVNLDDGKISNRVQVGDENTGAAITAAGPTVVISGPQGISLYSRGKCPVK